MFTESVLIIGDIPGAALHTLKVGAPELAIRLPEVAARGGQLVVCGGSLPGIKVAAQFAEDYPGLRVSLVTRRVFGEKLSKEKRASIRESFRRLGIEILDQLEIIQVTENALHFDGGRPMPFDVAVWAVPNIFAVRSA
jgi:NADH dehydrogenase FAD-containing subunit